MADSAKDAWNDVGERFTTLGRMLADRYREHQPTDESPSGTKASEADEDTRRKVEEAAREVSEQLNRAFTALGETLRDPEAKERLKDAVKTLGDAVTLTVNETADEVRTRLRSSGSDGPTDASGGTTPTA